jgi:hypothetical protein
MRTRTVATLVLLLALAAAGCNRGTGNGSRIATAQNGEVKPTTSASAPAMDDEEAMLKYAQCMRENGVPDFPDPQDGQQKIAVNEENASAFQAAQEACKKFMPGGGPGAHKPQPEEIERLRQLAKCMRENGVPNFPDPNADGGIMINPGKMGVSPEDPSWKKAEAACSAYQPKKGESRKQRVGERGTTGGQAG